MLIALLFGFALGFAVRHFSQPLVAKLKVVEGAIDKALK